jgi:hypothetical protein
LKGGDNCKVDDFVVVSGSLGSASQIARVDEIIQRHMSTSLDPDFILLLTYQLHPTPSSSNMPYLMPASLWLKARFEVRQKIA